MNNKEILGCYEVKIEELYCTYVNLCTSIANSFAVLHACTLHLSIVVTWMPLPS